MAKIQEPELQSLMMTSQDIFTSKKLRQSQLLPQKVMLKLLLREEMEVMELSLLTLLQLSLMTLSTLLQLELTLSMSKKLSFSNKERLRRLFKSLLFIKMMNIERKALPFNLPTLLQEELNFRRNHS